jgi:hypothetical protein
MTMKIYTEFINNRIKQWKRHRVYALTAIICLIIFLFLTIMRNDDWGFDANKFEYWGLIILGFSLIQLLHYWSGILTFNEHQILMGEHSDEQSNIYCKENNFSDKEKINILEKTIVELSKRKTDAKGMVIPEIVMAIESCRSEVDHIRMGNL